MLAVIDQISHGMLRAMGARTERIVTSAGEVHGYILQGRGEGRFGLLHGMGTTATAYTPVVRRLLPHAKRVVLLELPGHGRSPAPRTGLNTKVLAEGVREGLDQLLDRAELERIVLLGTSLGGAAALGYALDRPNRVDALVLASPAGAPLDPLELEALKRRFKLVTPADARRFFQELLHQPPAYTRLLERGLVKQLARPLVRDFLASLEAADFFTAEQVGALVPPATVLWGSSDRVLPRSGLEFFRRALPAGPHFEELERIGHSPHFERPALVAERMIAAQRRSAAR